jgi:hypothetical protein
MTSLAPKLNRMIIQLSLKNTIDMRTILEIVWLNEFDL